MKGTAAILLWGLTLLMAVIAAIGIGMYKKLKVNLRSLPIQPKL